MSCCRRTRISTWSRERDRNSKSSVPSSVLSVSTLGRALHDSLPLAYVLADGLFSRDNLLADALSLLLDTSLDPKSLGGTAASSSKIVRCNWIKLTQMRRGAKLSSRNQAVDS
jgi:hypothetical protein